MQCLVVWLRFTTPCGRQRTTNKLGDEFFPLNNLSLYQLFKSPAANSVHVFLHSSCPISSSRLLTSGITHNDVIEQCTPPLETYRNPGEKLSPDTKLTPGVVHLGRIVITTSQMSQCLVSVFLTTTFEPISIGLAATVHVVCVKHTVTSSLFYRFGENALWCACRQGVL